MAVLLIGFPDERGVLRFPEIRFVPKALTPIAEQLLREASASAQTDLARRVTLVDQFCDETTLPDGTTATVYLMTLDAHQPQGAAAPYVDQAWRSFPDILRAMPRDRGRLPYLRAWQVITGGLTLNTKAVDLEEVKRHLLDD